MRNLLCFFTLAGFILTHFSPVEADARVVKKLNYSKRQSYNASLRFLRVDRGFNIIEKDLESGYLMFEYPTDNSDGITNGSIEVIEQDKTVALVIQLPELPQYHERLLASGLLKKLRSDYGEPRRRSKEKPKVLPSPNSPEGEKSPEGNPGTPPKPNDP